MRNHGIGLPQAPLPHPRRGGGAPPEKHLEHPLGGNAPAPLGGAAHAAAYRRPLRPHGEERGPGLCGHRGGGQRGLCLRPGARLGLRHGGGHHRDHAARGADDEGRGHPLRREHGAGPGDSPPRRRDQERGAGPGRPGGRSGGTGRRGLSRSRKAEHPRGHEHRHPAGQRRGVRALRHLRPPGGPGKREERPGGDLQGQGDLRGGAGDHRRGGQQARRDPEARRRSPTTKSGTPRTRSGCWL